MSDSEELAEIRARKREELKRKLRGEEPRDENEGESEDGTEPTPTTPVGIEDDGQFAEFVATHDVVLVDFYADWCGPCKMLAPTVEEIAAESDAAVLKVDIDELQDLARDAGVRSVPTLQFYAAGEPVKRLIGVQDKDDLLDVVADLS
jgi:thioredoxin 1